MSFEQKNQTIVNITPGQSGFSVDHLSECGCNPLIEVPPAGKQKFSQVMS